MTRKDELIIGILKKELKHINKLLKDQEEQIEKLKKSGFDSDVHPAHRMDIRTGLSYTQGYCTGHLALAKNVIELLSMSDAKDIEALIEENKRIEQENKKHLREVFKEITKRVKENKKSSLDDVHGIWKGKKVSLDKIREKNWNRKPKSKK